MIKGETMDKEIQELLQEIQAMHRKIDAKIVALIAKIDTIQEDFEQLRGIESWEDFHG